MRGDVADQLDDLAKQAEALAKNLAYYWDEQGVSQLQIFIDPDLFQYIDRLYNESREFALQCTALSALADKLRVD
ncbi:MAG: hypothetical protein U9R25_14045 [Chloroflexota bacterium]|nr:hypothetical protein [Chloroflexota bacterium]